LATVVGEVTDGDHLVIDWQGERVVDVDPKTVAHEGPTYDRSVARPDWTDPVAADGSSSLPRPQTGQELQDQLLAVIASPNLADKSWITNQYDRFVRGNSALAQPEDAGMIRIDESTGLGVALATDCNARFAYLDPYLGAQIALAEAYRNVAISGAEPVAITDCLNFGSPEDPEIMWQFQEAIKGLVDGCATLGTPVTGGNVSFYNKTGDQAILPTPVVGMLGVIDDVADRVASGFTEVGDIIALIGDTLDELDGSAWSQVLHRHLGGTPPTVDLGHHQRLTSFFQTASKTHLLSSAHDLSDGGLGVALLESCFRHDRGAVIELEGDPFVSLFSESTGRVLISCSAANLAAVEALASANDLPLHRLGTVQDSDALMVGGQFNLPLEQAKAAWTATIPAALQS
jgi:phosphoribosylformylglycinamidine synthase